jgi:hypothetical protein
MRNSYLVLFTSLILFPSCHRIPQDACYKKTIECKKPTNTMIDSSLYTPTQPSDTITIWIHGTRVFFSKFICPNFFYTRRGLHGASAYGSHYHLREIAEILQHTAPDKFNLNNFYFYGWTGKLSFKARYKAARKLYELIIQLLESYERDYGFRPKIRIITHSHGGNVALNLARFNADLQLIVDELIVLACPVQKQTCQLIEHGTFKKIYSLYSRFDSFQVLDPQRIYYWLKKDYAESLSVKPDAFFSQRCFAHNDKIKQVQLKLNNRGIMHIEFIMNKFVMALPSILEEIESWDNPPHNGPHVIQIKQI